MKSPLILSAFVFLVILGVVLIVYRHGSKNKDKTYNWDLELTKPLDYNITINKVSYFKKEKEIYRDTGLNSISGWSPGYRGGRVMHSTQKQFLPDSIILSWTETNTKNVYKGTISFPKQKIIDYWNKNNELLKEKWGNNYDEGQLSLKLGISPRGKLVLWMHDLDINATGFVIEVGSFMATKDKSNLKKSNELEPSFPILQERFGSPYFYAFENENIIAITVNYFNGEANTINYKKTNGSLLNQVNQEIGWGLAKEIMVHWFTKNGIGYKSTYTIALEDTPIKNKLQTPENTHFVYLLDRPNTAVEEWNKLTNKHIFELKEKDRKPIKKNH